MIVMSRNISAIADRSSDLYCRRAENSLLRQTWGMANDDWRERLEAAVSKDGRSFRDISLAAGLSHGYLHGILRDNKEPTLDRFVRICKVLNISVAYALMGMDITRETEQIISEIEADGERRTAILQLLQARKAS